MILPFDYIGYKGLSENKRFPNHRWYSDTTGEGGMGECSPLDTVYFKTINITVSRDYT